MTARGPRTVAEARGTQLLDYLAHQINTAHDAAHVAARSAIEHAITCGQLLTEAKARVQHGSWLPCVEANLSFGPRQAQKYLRLAEKATELPNATSDAHLTTYGALALLADPNPEPAASDATEPGSWAWCDAQLRGPFSAWDLAGSDAQWLTTKRLHHAEIPAVANVCLQAQIEHGLPILRLVPADELYTSGEREPTFDHASLKRSGAIRFFDMLKLMAQPAVGLLAAEFEYRSMIDDDRYSRELDAIKARWIGRLRLVEQHLAEQRTAKAQP